MATPKTESELLQLINDQVEESLVLDYKRGEALTQPKSDLTKEVTKDVSAFANSAGGTIIYGIAEGTGDTKHLPVHLSPIDRKCFSKERLEQIINNIQPKVHGIEITPISLSSDDRHVAYVVVIPASTTAHQCTDKRYYRRYNFQATMMEDYEIRDVMNRNRFPILSIEVVLRLMLSKNESDFPIIQSHGKGTNTLYQNFWWIVKAKNDGSAVGHYLQGTINFPSWSLEDHHKSGKKIVDLDITNFLRTDYGSGMFTKPSEPEYKRILPGCSLEVLTESASKDSFKLNGMPFKIDWELFCDSSPPQRGTIDSKSVIIEVNSAYKKELIRNSISLEDLGFASATLI